MAEALNIMIEKRTGNTPSKPLIVAMFAALAVTAVSLAGCGDKTGAAASGGGGPTSAKVPAASAPVSKTQSVPPEYQDKMKANPGVVPGAR